MGAELCALGQHAVHLLKGEVLLVAVLRRPAARAAHIAGARRVHEDDPRDVAVILFGVCPRLLEAAEAALVGGGRQEGPEKVGVALAQQALGVVCPFAVGGVCNLVQHLEGLRRPDAGVDLLDHVDKVVCDGADVLVWLFLMSESSMASKALRSAAWAIFSAAFIVSRFLSLPAARAS